MPNEDGTPTTEEEIAELKLMVLELGKDVKLLKRTAFKTIGEEGDQV